VLITMGCGDVCAVFPASGTSTGSSTTPPAGTSRRPPDPRRDPLRSRTTPHRAAVTTTWSACCAPRHAGARTLAGSRILSLPPRSALAA